MRAPVVGCELNAKEVCKLLPKGIPVRERSEEPGLRPVPLLGDSGETLVEVVKPLVLCDTSMLAVTEETVNKFLYEDTYLEDIAALTGKHRQNGFGAASTTTGCATWVCHVILVGGVQT